MPHKKVALIVYIDLDPIPGVMHTEDSAREVVSAHLTNAMNHYNPRVLVGPPHMQMPSGSYVTQVN